MHKRAFNWRHGATENCCSKPVLPISAQETASRPSSLPHRLLSLLITFQPSLLPLSPSAFAGACRVKLAGALRIAVAGILAGLRILWQLQTVAAFDLTPQGSGVKQHNLRWRPKYTTFSRCHNSSPGAVSVYFLLKPSFLVALTSCLDCISTLLK